jgi:predicted nuclease of predicted toxin-antitoxin system
MKIVIDMNLSPAWCALLDADGHEACHWQSVGSPSAADATILTWARDNGFVVFTNDLDFGAILAATSRRSPSVVQLRGKDITPQSAGAYLVATLACYAPELEKGALLTIDQERCRVRMLPVRCPTD